MSYDPTAYDPDPSPRAKLRRLLSMGYRLTQQKAAKRLGVKSRRVRDIVDELIDRGVPIKKGYENRERIYFLRPEDRHADPVTLDLPEQQHLALLVATQAARPTLEPTPLVGALDAAAEVLKDTLEPHVFSFIPAFESEQWHFSRAVSVPIDPDIFWTLRTAIADNHPVLVDYFTASRDAWSRDRKINPLLFAVRKGAWLCVAYCHERRRCLDFSLVDIENVRICEEERYTPPTDFDRNRYFEGRFGALDAGEEQEVRIWVSPNRARYFERKLYHPTQQFTVLDDGALEVTFQVRGTAEIKAFLLSWGPHVRVIHPQTLADQIARDARALVQQYAASPADPSK